jgi:hypothetical protein
LAKLGSQLLIGWPIIIPTIHIHHQQAIGHQPDIGCGACLPPFPDLGLIRGGIVPAMRGVGQLPAWSAGENPVAYGCILEG